MQDTSKGTGDANDPRGVDILAIGEPLMEFSAEEEGGLDCAGRYLAGHGGDASNFAVAAARSGARVGMLTRIGTDPFGDAFMTLWRSEGVDCSLVGRDTTAPTGVYFISRAAGRHQFTYYRAGSAASAMRPGDLPREAVAQARLLHCTGVTQGISHSARQTVFAAMDMAREAGATISYDPNYRPVLWPLDTAREVIHEAVSRADIVFPSMEEAAVLTGLDDPEAAARFYLGLGASVVALKLGEQGVLLATAQGLERIPAIEVRAVDGSGAGDAFAGAFVAAHLEGRPLTWCARYAAAVAALATTGLGCVGAHPLPGRRPGAHARGRGGLRPCRIFNHATRFHLVEQAKREGARAGPGAFPEPPDIQTHPDSTGGVP